MVRRVAILALAAATLNLTACPCDPGNPNGLCPNDCRDVGQSCTGNDACCSGACFSPGGAEGTCCALSGQSCSSPYDCCHHVCASGVCQ